MTSRWKRYWLIFLLVCLLLPTHRYVFGPSAGGEFSNDAGKTPGYFLIEMILIIFLSFIFLSAFFLAFRRRLLNGGFWRGYFFTVLALMFFLILFKFPARPQQMVVSLLFEVGLIFFCFVSGRYLMKKISAGPAYPLRKVLFFAVFWAGWVTFFYAFFKFWGLAQFSGGSPAKVNILFYFFSVLAGSIWASISEETIYRLYLINFLQSLGLGNFFPVVFSAVFWALAHAGGEVHPFYLRMIEIFPVGIGLGFLYLKFGYFFVLAVHFLTDLILMGLPGIYVSSWLVVPFLGLMLISAALVFLACHQKPSVTRLWMKAGLASGAILKKSKMVFLFAAIFLMFLVFNNSVEAMNLKEFCTGVFEKDLSLGQTRARFEIEELNRKLLKSNRYPKISFYIRSERLNLPDFWVRSLKDSLPTLENLGTDRWQVQSGLTGNWLLYDPLNLYKEKLAVRRCQINQQELADSEAKFSLYKLSGS